jgi:hypothetical protein
MLETFSLVGPVGRSPAIVLRGAHGRGRKLLNNKSMLDRDLDQTDVSSFAFGVAGALLIALVLGLAWADSTGGPEPRAAVEYTAGDRTACRAVMHWYDQEGPNPSDQEAGRFFMRQFERADTERVRERIKKDAIMWASGAETWSPGAQETCVLVLR